MFKKYMLLFLIIAVSGVWAAGENQGKTGLSYLKIAVDARAVGMGEAFTAMANDASAVYWNPAGLMGARASNVIFNHNEWIEDIRGEFAAIQFVKSKSSFAFHVRSFNLGDIEVRNRPTTEPLETTGAHYLSLGVSYARQFNRSINWGISMKYLFEKIYVEEASGFAADFGLTYQSPFPFLKFAATVQNLGKMNNLKNESTELPMIVRAGLAYQMPFNSDKLFATMALDFMKAESEDPNLHIGGEVILWKQLALRLGILEGYEAKNYAFGVGFLRNSLRVDYALTPFSDDLGVAHRFSLNFNI
ncbi:MAG: hypothetical protein Kow0037_10430 [Calditrichia bacterium]